MPSWRSRRLWSGRIRRLTNFESVGRRGKQEPRVKLVPPGELAFDEAEECIDLSTAYGMAPDEWQRGVIFAWLGTHADGQWAAARCGLAVPRQNGKNGVLEMVELHKMVQMGRKILHTAHEVKTARKAFLRLASFFENEREYPELAEMVVSIRRTNGQEAIFLNNGASIEFIARSKGSGRGFTVDDLVCDEAQDLNDDALAALLPTISAAPSGNPQTIFTGTPPVYRADGAVWQRFRDEGVKGTDKRLAWLEWSVPDDLRDLDKDRDREKIIELAWETNPALGIRLSIETVTDELAAMSIEVFLRERLGQWEDVVSGSRLISSQLWAFQGRDAEMVRELTADGTRSFAITFSLDGTRASVCGGVKHPDGVHAELVDAKHGDLEGGITKLAEWLAERKDTTAMFAISGRAWAAVLQKKLRALKVPERAIHVLSTPEYFTACAMAYDDLLEGTLTHSAVKSQEALDRSVAACDKKERGGGAWGWEATVEGADETPIEAFSIVNWAAKTTKRKPGRKQVLI